MGTSRHADTRRRRRAITLEDRDFILGAAAWIAKTDVSAIDLGLSPDEALHRAPEFLRVLREGKISPAEARIDDAGIDVLHAACRLLAEPNAGGVEVPLDSVRALYDFIEKVTWPGPDFDERAELLAACAFAGWRIARRHAMPPVTDEWQKRLLAVTPKMVLNRNSPSVKNAARDSIEITPQAKTDLISITEEGENAALHALSTPMADRVRKEAGFSLDDPETLLPLLDELRRRGETSPAEVLNEATFLYSFLERHQPCYPVDAFLLDEREYFLGETARLAGSVSRELSRRQEARKWLDLADRWFLSTENAAGNLAKVSYQRLALWVEELDFEAVAEPLPQLIGTFRKLGMSEDALKCAFLQAAVLKETDRLLDAATIFEQIAAEAKDLRNENLLALAYVNLVQIHGSLGESQAALSKAREAEPVLRQLGNRLGLAKLQWGVGTLFRSQGDVKQAIESYRASQEEFAGIGLRADVAALQLIIADLLLDAGQEKQAEWEIRQALPLIDEYKLVPEGFAAMTLLRESLRRQKIDREALRNLHEHFEQKKP